MDILQYTPDMQTQVTQFYNRMTANVPKCYPVKAEEFADCDARELLPMQPI